MRVAPTGGHGNCVKWWAVLGAERAVRSEGLQATHRLASDRIRSANGFPCRGREGDRWVSQFPDGTDCGDRRAAGLWATESRALGSASWIASVFRDSSSSSPSPGPWSRRGSRHCFRPSTPRRPPKGRPRRRREPIKATGAKSRPPAPHRGSRSAPRGGHGIHWRNGGPVLAAIAPFRTYGLAVPANSSPVGVCPPWADAPSAKLPGRFRDATRATLPPGGEGPPLDPQSFGTYGVSWKRRAADGPTPAGDREAGDEASAPRAHRRGIVREEVDRPATGTRLGMTMAHNVIDGIGI